MVTTLADPLAGLSPGERRILLLLGEGHTAKTIATELGVSEGAVNERLRAARRKAGVGSSRELARMLRARENRDEEIGLAGGEPLGEATAAPPHRAWRRIGGPAVMIAIILAAAAVIGHRPPVPADDPLLAALLNDANPVVLRDYRRVRIEHRDADWAGAAEALLRTRYGRVIGSDRSLRVTCAASLCEVAGVLPSGGGDTAAALQRLGLEELPTEGNFAAPASFSIGTHAGLATFAAYPLRPARGAGATRGGAAAVVATSPGDGTLIAAGPFALTVTFDRPMRARSYSFTTPEGPARYPRCEGQPVQSADRRSFTLRCVADPGHAYAVGFNTPPYRNFVSEDGMPAASATVRFGAR